MKTLKDLKANENKPVAPENLDLAKDFNSRLVWGICFILACILGFLGLIFDVQNPGDMEKGGGLFGYVFYPFLLGT